MSLSHAHTVLDPDAFDCPIIALHLDFRDYATEVPFHRHAKGQLVLALHGAVTCRVPNGWWIVPPNCGVWIPGGVDHSNRATPNARLSFLFVDPAVAALPHHCCTLSISPMIREMILHLADFGPSYDPGSRTDRLARLLTEELAVLQGEELHLPVPDHPKIRHIADALGANPADRGTIGEWAARVAVSERSLARMMVRETGLTFGRWRQQLHLLIALRELASGASVQTVAAELGYESVTAFITMFKKALGKTPARYFAQ